MELTEKEFSLLLEVMTEKRDTLNANAERAIKRLCVYQNSPDLAGLYTKAKKTVDGNIEKIKTLDGIIEKMTA